MGILDQFRLDGRVALVTGASRGLGLAIAEALAGAGADVAVTGTRGAPEAAAAVRAAGRRTADIAADLGTGRAACHDAVARTVDGLGRIDILVNNAGIIRRADFLAFTDQDWDEVMGVNIDAVFRLSQEAARHMARQGGGRIINIASMLSFQGGIRVPSYAASKSAVAGLTRLMACELAGHGIAVNAIAPGYMATDNTAALREDAARNRAILERIPAGRWGAPADLQGMAVFLASPAAAYCNGGIYTVDGGFLCR